MGGEEKGTMVQHEIRKQIMNQQLWILKIVGSISQNTTQRDYDQKNMREELLF